MPWHPSTTGESSLGIPWRRYVNRQQDIAQGCQNWVLGRGDICILALPSDAFCATLLIATLLLGGIPLLVAPPVIQIKGRYSNLTQVLRHVIRKTRPQIVIAPKAMADMREELESSLKKTRFIFGEENLIPDPSAAMSLVAPRDSDIAAMQLTSGTTGFPRVCVWHQTECHRRAGWYCARHGFK